MGSIDIALPGKILLITGGASGIGLSLTKKSYDLGARVLVADIQTTPEFDSFAAGEDNIVYVHADVTRWPDFMKLFDTCERKWNDVPDAYAICAGVFGPDFSNFWLDTEDEGYKQVEIYVSHPIKLTRLAIKKSLGKGKRASVCIIVSEMVFHVPFAYDLADPSQQASIAGLAGNLAAPLYCATKHAMVYILNNTLQDNWLTY